MKIIYRLFAFIALTVVFSACMDTYTEVFTANSPVYMSYEDLRLAVKSTAARDLEKPGKIYFKDNYIFVVEDRKGVHIIDLQNPSSPQKRGFIEVPGCVDIAIRQSTLYADSYIDLVAIDVSDLNNIREVARLKDVLPYLVPPADNNFRMAEVDKDKGVVIDWEIKKVRQEMEYRYYPVYPMWGGRMQLDASYSNSSGGVGGSSGSASGIGGSMARFGLYGDYLYAVDNSNCYMFDVRLPASPVNAGKQNVGWDVETMFIYDNHMFLGTMSGMIILSLEVPLAPKYVSNFWHVTSCDPVVVSDGYAYVTLRGGQVCRSTTNRLDVIQLGAGYKSNLLVGSFNMNSPYGLGIDGDILFVCDGDAGLKVFNASDKTRVGNNQIASFPNIKTYDVIPVNGLLFMIGSDGFYLYDYSNIQNIVLKGQIPVKK
ncbi:MAG: LVIVD repeat-containing protein [Bacteroidota bacterium]